jgi:hypothetical protein
MTGIEPSLVADAIPLLDANGMSLFKAIRLALGRSSRETLYVADFMAAAIPLIKRLWVHHTQAAQTVSKQVCCPPSAVR